MKRLLVILASVALIACGSGAASAASPKAPEFKLPQGALRINDDTYYLGARRDPSTGKMIEGVAYLHPKQAYARVSPAAGKADSTCYSFLARGLKWKTVEPWLLDGANTAGLGSNYLITHTAANLAKWETAAGATIFGDGSLGNGLSADTSAPDGQNEVLFGSIADPGVIAVTIVWGYYSGPTQARQILEWDQMFDDQDFTWSSDGAPGTMDFDNISTHEIGHAAGMGHPSSTCTEETMYAYANTNEIKKRDLNTGDITGIRTLY